MPKHQWVKWYKCEKCDCYHFETDPFYKAHDAHAGGRGESKLETYLVVKLRQENTRLREALDDMVSQFAYWGGGGLVTGGLSALEHAFAVLGYDEPHLCPEQTCDVQGCHERTSAGWPSKDGYRRTCSKHTPSPRDWK